ncbi:cation transporter [Microbacterium protaetiae]|uniref:Cation transporter n=1 Tax=Microbacterium protaetiae TaxID=2509458 RepID=A0A4P6ESM1_9MICO|nr:cation transporter [Microbacterium protaetiae]QAY60978.1 cation transporter [Microbacterium protaetiae]
MAAASRSSSRGENRALAVSMAGSAVLGTGGVVWGVIIGSQIVLFDGVVTLAGIMLVLVSMIAARVAASRPTTDYPYGRHAATPLAVTLQGAALVGALVYGASEAVTVIVAGGSAPAGVAVAAYGVVAALASVVVIMLLATHARSSPLAHAELVSWRSGAYLSGVVVLGGVASAVLTANDLDTVAGFLDPSLVLLATILMLPMALGLVREGGRELLEAAPPRELAEQVDAAVERVRRRHDLPVPVVRSTKLGRRLYVDVGFVVPDSDWDVAHEDEVRHELTDELGGLDYDVIAGVIITRDPRLFE